MKNIVPFPAVSNSYEEASHWVARFDRGPLGEAELVEFKRWLASDVRNQQAVREIANLWQGMDALAVLSEMFPESLCQNPNHNTPDPPSSRTGLWRKYFPDALLAMALTACLVVGAFFIDNRDAASPITAGKQPVELVFQTEVGEQSATELGDGSRMTLNTASVARVRFTDAERAVILERGEGHFMVAKNPARPFVVYAGQGRVRAVGTAFSIRLDTERVDVTVTEGTVQVETTPKARASRLNDKDSAPGKALQTVTLSERGVANYRDSIESVRYLEMETLEHKMAWKNGKWIFEGETLEYVIAEANRYTADKIEIRGGDIGSLRVGGYFNVGEVDRLLAVLESGFGLRVTRPRDGLIVLSSEDNAKTLAP